MEKELFKDWCILELMGHRRLAGLIQEAQIGGAPFIRIDVPGASGMVATQFYSPSSIFCITPVTEELARNMAKYYQPEPVNTAPMPTEGPDFRDGGPKSGRAFDDNEDD